MNPEGLAASKQPYFVYLLSKLTYMGALYKFFENNKYFFYE